MKHILLFLLIVTLIAMSSVVAFSYYNLPPIQDVLGRDLVAPVGTLEADTQMNEASQRYIQQGGLNGE